MKTRKKKYIPRRRRADSKYYRQLEQMHWELLETADGILKKSGFLNTTVRETIAEGLAYLVQSAYDCKACTMNLDFAAFCAFVETSTAQWFRRRGFAEWFCQGAATGFTIGRPRTLQEMLVKIVYRKKGVRKKK